MIERNRAWRRRKAKVILSKLQKTQQWFSNKFEGKTPNNAISANKQHQHGKLTHVQDQKLMSGLNDEIHDREWQASPVYHFPPLSLGCMGPR